MKQQGTINSLCREFPELAKQIRHAGARIVEDHSREETLYGCEEHFGEPVPHAYRLYFSVFAKPNIPGDTVLWLTDEGCGN
jgi:hypothetical protein